MSDNSLLNTVARIYTAAGQLAGFFVHLIIAPVSFDFIIRHSGGYC